MTSPIRIPDLPLWERHQEKVLAIAREALQLLKEDWPSGDERVFNKQLLFCLLKANSNARNRGEPHFDYTPTWEAQTQPVPDSDEGPEHKRPDFHWSLIDHEAPDPTRSGRYFVMECKRLGEASASGWSFNRHYVDDGIVRFVDAEWQYGRGVSSGAMVGYIETIGFSGVLDAVQTRIGEQSLPPLSTLSSADDLSELDHSLERPFAVTPFRLIHLWIDHSAVS